MFRFCDWGGLRIWHWCFIPVTPAMCYLQITESCRTRALWMNISVAFETWDFIIKMNHFTYMMLFWIWNWLIVIMTPWFRFFSSPFLHFKIQCLEIQIKKSSSSSFLFLMLMQTDPVHISSFFMRIYVRFTLVQN